MKVAQSATEVIDAVQRFNEAFERRDFEKLENTITEDCVFEDTDPRPDGKRYEGKKSVLSFFKEMAASSPNSRFEIEDTFTSGDRCVVLWNHHWTCGGNSGNNRGVDIFRIRAGKVGEKISYTKNG